MRKGVRRCAKGRAVIALWRKHNFFNIAEVVKSEELGLKGRTANRISHAEHHACSQSVQFVHTINDFALEIATE